MREQNLIDELNRFDADERFALEKCGYSPDDKLEGKQKEIFEYERKSLREKIAVNLYNIKNWNKSNLSGVPPRFADTSFFNFECRNESEKSCFEKAVAFSNIMKKEGGLLMTRAKGTGTVGGKEAAEGEGMGEINA
ncbi:MAG: hypothetical protein SPG48_11895 [Treponema sp.]|nr:hypothetical protein [Treponema sp.]